MSWLSLPSTFPWSSDGSSESRSCPLDQSHPHLRQSLEGLPRREQTSTAQHLHLIQPLHARELVVGGIAYIGHRQCPPVPADRMARGAGRSVGDLHLDHQHRNGTVAGLAQRTLNQGWVFPRKAWRAEPSEQH